MAPPNHIFTTFFAVSGIIISHEEDDVLLMGIYGNLQTDSMDPIEVEMNFNTLYNLLTEVGREAEYALKEITKALNKPEGEFIYLDLCLRGGISFLNHLFAFVLITEREDEGEIYKCEETRYILTAFIPRNNFFPQFIDNFIPESPAERADYLHRQLALKYRFYLHFKSIMPEEDALFFSNLWEPLVFTLAKTQFENCYKKSGK